MLPLLSLGVETEIIVAGASPWLSARTVLPPTVPPTITGILVVPEFSNTVNASGFAWGFKSTRLMVAVARLLLMPLLSTP